MATHVIVAVAVKIILQFLTASYVRHAIRQFHFVFGTACVTHFFNIFFKICSLNLKKFTNRGRPEVLASGKLAANTTVNFTRGICLRQHAGIYYLSIFKIFKFDFKSFI